MKLDLPVKAFKTEKEFEKWLNKNHTNQKGIWLKFYKKNSGIKTIIYDEALDVALCYGWIDGQTRSLDAKTYLQRFTPRRKRSIWSQRNIEHISRLTKAKRMKFSGLTAVAEAKKNGQWANAYGSPSKMVMPNDFLKLVQSNKKASDFFINLNQANKYAIYYQLTHAKKAETRQRRMKKFFQMMKRGEKLY